ncbi:MAG: hypothetical protein A2Z34_06100 [Planctomycetes bacterium RBG_16_59_8]|nr:MAG: hypothetical protein A2Z34_06100 [Planctomycetes bacterium RBG_16_59_8]
MNSKERVRTALLRKSLPDRVPVQFDLCRSLLEAFGEKYRIPVDYTVSYYEDVTYRISANDLRTAMGSDCAIVGASLPSGYRHRATEDGCFYNEFGMKMKPGPLYMDVVECPFAKNASDNAVRDFPFPDPLADGRYDKAKRDIEKFGKTHFVISDVELTIFEMAWHMVGLEKFLTDMAMKESYVGILLDKIKEFSIGVCKRMAELGVDGIWTGDDVGTQKGMMISPKMWRSLFKPRLAEIFQEIKATNRNVTVMYHSDGAVAPILDDLADIGLEVLNPVQPNVPGHDPAELKSGHGSRLSFWGAIDQQELLPRGTPEEIEKEVAKRIGILGAGGGYLCAPAHIVQADVSMENVEAFIAAVKKHGVYPLKG